MNEPVYAKSNPVETLQEHTQKLLDCYEALKNTGYLDSEKVQRYDKAVQRIIELHDCGKLNHKFQNKLRKSLKKSGIKKIRELADYGEIYHEWLSLAFISREDRNFFKQFNSGKLKFNELAKYCIAFHHTRSDEKFDFPEEIYEKFVEFDLEPNKHRIPVDYDLNPKCKPGPKDIKEYFEKFINMKHLALLVFVKGILHKCDYAASAGIEIEQPYHGNYRADFEKRLFNLKGEKIILKPYQEEARNYSDKSVVLVASTGTGKTEYSMNWIDGGKAFYLLGLRTAVNAMYDRFEKVFGGENVSLLHGETSAFLAEKYDNIQEYFDRGAIARQLASPLTIATADQLVISVFKYNSFELTYLTASFSKIVVDEIQSFSPDAIAAIVTFLKEIHKLGGKFLLMTATLPPFIADELSELADVVFPEKVLDKTRRHFIQCIPRNIDNSESIEEIQDFAEKKDRKILVICNTVPKAQQIYEALESFQPNLIHSRFINKDRKEKERAIFDAAEAKGPCIWISTQIVEASLDIDFDMLFMECATIDSVFQRFGRCYRGREREYFGDVPNIYIYAYGKTDSNIYDPELLERTWNILQEFGTKPVMETDKQEMINRVFTDIENTKYHKEYSRLKELLEKGFRARNRFEAQKEFRSITSNYTVIPEPVYQKEADRIRELTRKIDSRDNSDIFEKLKAKSELMSYTFSLEIFSRQRRELLSEIPDSDFCKRREIFLISGVEYTAEKGLVFQEKQGY